MSSLHLSPETSVLLIIDVQERLAAAMSKKVMEKTIKNLCTLLEAARRLAVPVILSEQYPKGLGATVAPLQDALNELDDLTRLEKVDFSVGAVPEFQSAQAAASESGRKQWVICGMETHICVYQSTRYLIDSGAQAHVVADAVVSRSTQNFEIGLGLMGKTGAAISSTEVVVMDWLSRAQGDDFKAISKLIR